MQNKLKAPHVDYNESKEEAKNPGALLGLIMGVYPVILIIGLLVAIAFVSLRPWTNSAVPEERPSDSETLSQPTGSSNDNKLEKENP